MRVFVFLCEYYMRHVVYGMMEQEQKVCWEKQDKLNV